MKHLAAILAYFKYAILAPFAALVIWSFTSFSSACIRFYPRIIQMLDVQLQTWDVANHELSEFTVLEMFYYGLYNVLGFIEKLVVSLNFWLPVEIIVNVTATAILISIGFFIFRVFIKLLTLGQI